MFDLDAIFKPQSIAILGASPNGGAAKPIITALRQFGYEGRIYPVNPKYEEIEGLRCYPSVAEIPERVDAAAIVTGAKAAVSLVDAAGESGVKGAVIFAVGFNESGTDGLLLENELRTAAHRHSMAVVGPNCMGALAPAHGTTLYSGALRDIESLRGRTAVISQSGSVAIALLGQARRLGGFSIVVSSGNETVCTAADYLKYAVEDPETDRVALFLEAVRDPERFRRAAVRAHELGKPIVALKVGKSAAAARNVAAHTGALAGSARVTSAFLRACHVHEVDSLSELTETIVLFQHATAPRGRRLGAIHPSGGEASLLIDAVHRHGLEFPPLRPQAAERMAAELHPWFADAANPLDAWGPIPYSLAYEMGLRVLADQDDIDAIVVLHDAADTGAEDDPEVSLNVIRYAKETQRQGGKPVVLVSNLGQSLDPRVVAALDDAGIPGLVGTDAAAVAVARWLAFHEAQRGPIVGSREPGKEFASPTLPEVSGSLNEVESKQLLAQFGISTPSERFVTSPDAAIDAAAEIGYPVVLKAVARSLEHKSDGGLVMLDIDDEAGLLAAILEVQSRLDGTPPDGFLVASYVAGAREVLVGITRDPTFGPTVVVGAGGVMTEILDDAAIGLPPLSVEQARALIDQLRIRPMLDEWRGRPPADVAALAELVVSMGDLALGLGDRLEAAEVNPVAVLPEGEGVVALDALVTLRGAEQDQMANGGRLEREPAMKPVPAP